MVSVFIRYYNCSQLQGLMTAYWTILRVILLWTILRSELIDVLLYAKVITISIDYITQCYCTLHACICYMYTHTISLYGELWESSCSLIPYVENFGVGKIGGQKVAILPVNYFISTQLICQLLFILQLIQISLPSKLRHEIEGHVLFVYAVDVNSWRVGKCSQKTF